MIFSKTGVNAPQDLWKDGAVILFDKWKERGLKQKKFLQRYALISICTEKYVQTEKSKSSEKNRCNYH